MSPLLYLPSHKHLVEQGFLDILQQFQLTLMKGDEVVKTREKCTNGLLLGDVGESYTKPFEITRMYMDDSFSLCLLSKQFLTRTMRQTIGEE